MVQIARLAKLDEVQALVDLQIWKAKDADVQNAFQRIRQIVTSAAAALILLIAGQMIVFSNQADAADPVRIDCVEDYTLSQIISDFRTVTYALMMWLFALHFLLNLLPSG
jgi:two-component sensor histidine kinase